MKAITLNKLTQIIGGKLISNSPSKVVQSLNFGNPRNLERHQVYFYTRKLSWDNKQLPAIQRVRPAAVVLPDVVSTRYIPAGTAVIRVKDAYQAFWKAGLWNWKQYPTRVIGITGSAGKSTTTEMVASILKYRWSMVKTQGNLNTFSFLPSYLVRLQSKHNLLLLEMGMKSLNNIRKQCQVVHPEIGVVTNVGEAHVGSLGNLDMIVQAKQEMIDGVRQGGTLFLNADDKRSRKLNVNGFKGKLKTFGIDNKADIRANNIRYTRNGMSFNVVLNGAAYPFFIPVYGIHNVYNALAAIGVTHEFGATLQEMQKGLATFRAPKMRMQFIHSRSGRLLINDAWNANPSAMAAGLQVLKNIAPHRPAVAVLGDMLELGHLTKSAHEYIGKYVAQLGIDRLVTIGKNGKIIAASAVKNGMDNRNVFSYATRDQVVNHIARTPKNSIVYFKASRKLRLEKVVQRLK
ncbi:UDP-N-acetylmuramoyl-tripeptide--D-alanyl-D-alanine ligase [Paenactinomyces guangxiensis]|uniref:UDP-N-acetylmuramoyl-tripeptide--D-alanyl-D-alanine ligase n=1 Tax=Paenactinomyces guangxiensis TaxID=1490290 RepID=A0A7W2A8R3_9BACL|nr:UDP-N-acetylmuramoyl-tripeptide--D-alanyl-D-alanine ligase [Paenactinomyces guangxiensis]MBA4494464.1 UDP-N-acetylmuramoyl-tripeptide--D-alanyl-D-alanine ligase [Paenactinomyces guangxiensis]MBH8591481.1 UDP-N-acetylmuramoyl-tripeptide--D-alanyl-D-alanine ligase [Paenactinomyces guangxiensis]